MYGCCCVRLIYIYFICQNLKKSRNWYGAQETSLEHAFARIVNLLVANDDAFGQNSLAVFECRVDLTILEAISQIGAENGRHRSKVQHGV